MRPQDLNNIIPISKNFRNEKKKIENIKVNLCHILFPLNCFLGSKNSKDIQIYNLIKKYIFKKLCIKEFLSKINELEKLKFYLLDDLKLKHFEEQPNYFPYSEKVESIWDRRIQEI